MLNVSGKNWEIHSTLNSWRSGASSVVIGNKVWVVGGYDDSGSSKTTSEYLTDGKWTVGPSIPGAGVYISCMTYLNSSHIILIGGYYDRRQVRLFDTTTETWYDWTDLVSLPYPVDRHDCITVEDGVLLTGGYNWDSRETTSQSWIVHRAGNLEQVGDMSRSRMGHRMVRLGAKIFSLGGWGNGYNELSSIDEWIPGNKTWVRSPYQLNTGNVWFGALVIREPSTSLCV